MTNEQLKQQAIQEAYGEHWDEVKSFVDSEGFFSCGYSPEEKKLFAKIYKIAKREGWSIEPIRPTLLKGLHNNNGWVRISEDGSNLPAEGEYMVGELNEKEFKEYASPFTIGKIKKWHSICLVTHYRPVVEHPKPVY